MAEPSQRSISQRARRERERQQAQQRHMLQHVPATPIPGTSHAQLLTPPATQVIMSRTHDNPLTGTLLIFFLYLN